MSENTKDVFDLDDADFIKQYGTFNNSKVVEPASDDLDLVDVESEDSYDSEEESVDNHNDDEYAHEYSESNDDYDSNENEQQEEDYDLNDAESSGSTKKVRNNYKADLNRIIGTPIKGAGKEITLDNVDDAIRLIQMGMGYQKSMEQMKPHKRTIAMLEKNGLLDEGKLNYAIDLINKNPKAIQKLISDSDIDLFELDEDTDSYNPTNYGVSEEQLALESAISDIEGTPTAARTITVLGSEWDNASKEIVQRNPELIRIINEHMQSGIFDTVSNKVSELKTLGKLPYGMSDLEAYRYVGDALYADSNPQSAPNNGQQYGNSLANVSTPIKKPSRESVIRQKRATNVPRSSNRYSSQTNVWDMDDDEFIKQFGRGTRSAF